MCIDNILLAAGTFSNGNHRSRAFTVLKRLGLSDRATHKPSELSAGERQRIAMARAMLNRPKLILADEPTGNLDPENASRLIKYLEEYHKEGGTVIVATHGSIAEQYANRIIHLKNGRIAKE